MLYPLYRWEDGGTRWLSNILKISLLVCCRAVIWVRVVWLQSPCYHPPSKLQSGDGDRLEVPGMGSAGNGKEPCLVNHRVQTTFRILGLKILDWEGPIPSNGGKTGLWPDLGLEEPQDVGMENASQERLKWLTEAWERRQVDHVGLMSNGSAEESQVGWEPNTGGVIEWWLGGWEEVGKEDSSVLSDISMAPAPPSLRWQTTIFLKQPFEVVVLLKKSHGKNVHFHYSTLHWKFWTL